MKQKRFLLVAGVGLLVALLCWLNRVQHHQEAASQTTSIEEEVKGQSVTNKILPSRANGLVSTNAVSSLAPTNQTRPKQVSPEQWFEERFSHPMALYGKVVDEDEHPVQGATAEFEWINANGEPRYSTNWTDAGGLFSIEGLRGKMLNVAISKEGYYFSRKQNQCGFEYADSFSPNFYTPDVHNPVVFHLRKKGVAEQIIARRVRLHFDGQTLGFDPLKCKITAGGPLLFNFLSEPGRTNLVLRISVPNGGIQLANGEYPFEAPESGYKGWIELDQASIPQSQEELQCFFYLEQPGLYGRLRLTKYDLLHKGIAVTYFINPSGSRNLEFDPQAFISTVPEYYLRSNTPSIDSLP